MIYIFPQNINDTITEVQTGDIITEVNNTIAEVQVNDELAMFILHYLAIYLIIYLIVYLLTNKKNWDMFTRGISTINSIVCIKTIYNMLMNETITNYSNLNYTGSLQLVIGLTLFYIYLFVDGLFYSLYFIRNINANNFTTLAHHVVGGYGIYLIATQRMGLAVGIYFAATEISTPLLNLSWYLYVNDIKNRFTNLVFITFYIIFIITRIITIPFLIYYLYLNNIPINELTLLNYIMLYGGSACLVGLNLIWVTMLTKKLF